MNKLFYIMCYIMAGIGFGAFCFSVNEWWLEATKTMALSRTDAITIGTVSTIDQRESSQSFQGYWSRSRVNYAIASYEVRGQTYSVTLNDSWVELQPPRYEVGQSVSIVYISNHPEVSCLNTWSGIWKGFIQRSLVLLVGFYFILTLALIPQNHILLLGRPLFVFPAMSFLAFAGGALLYQGIPLIIEFLPGLRGVGIFMSMMGLTLMALTKAVWKIFEQ